MGFDIHWLVMVVGALGWAVLFAIAYWIRRRPTKSRMHRGRICSLWRRRPMSCCCLCLALFSVFVGICYSFVALTEFANRWFESNVMKSPLIHNFFQTSKNSTKLASHTELIVFQHIPRTAGDAMRTHLFNDVTIDYIPLWIGRKDVPVIPWERTNGSMYMMEDMRTKMVKGYFSRDDIVKVKRPIKLFTVLRHPMERALSFYRFTNRLNSVILGRKTRLTLEEYFDNQDPGLQPYFETYLHNSMTYQLGCQMNSEYRDQCTPEEALSRAKDWITKMDYVAFFENYMWDFRLIREKIFPDVQVPEFFPFLFEVGLWLSFPKVLPLFFALVKFTSHPRLY